MITHDGSGLLNKLTLEKYDVIVPKILGAGINTGSLLEGVVGLVFEKVTISIHCCAQLTKLQALYEQGFSTMYARLCVELSRAWKRVVDGDKTYNFRSAFITRVQEDFQKEQPAECMLPPPTTCLLHNSQAMTLQLPWIIQTFHQRIVSNLKSSSNPAV